jgi:cytochrome P450
MKDRYGDAVSYYLGTFRTYQFTDPELIEEVLIRKHRSFHKDAITHDLEELLGRGLLTSEGTFWRRQRKLAAPSLQRRQIRAYADWMVDITERELETWRDGEEFELHHAMMGLTLKIVVKTLFNLEMEDKIEEIGESIDTAMHVFDKSTHTLWRYVPEQIPTHLSRAFDQAVAHLDEVVYDLIDKRRASGEEGDDLLWRFLVANDEDGNTMTDRQLRDEVITMFLAGHETTALAITYAWFLMSHHPDVAQRLFDEVDEVLGDRSATAEDVNELPYLKAIVQETLRMYSPAWIIGREPVEDVQIGPYHVPKGTQVLMPQSVIHYDERWFDHPYEFRPERWLGGELEKELPRFAYFPFGGGARVCIGNHFAMMEAILIIATMAQRFDLENIMTDELETQPSVTLRPSVPVEMRVHER